MQFDFCMALGYNFCRIMAMEVINMPTPHNSAAKGDFAKTVLMPGDPLRSKYIAENFLTEARLVNNVRGVQGYTGLWKGAEVSVQASGMGIPSIGIYSWELYKEYGVENIIRIGSAGGLSDELQLMDVVAAVGACTDSNFAHQFGLNGCFAPTADWTLLSTAMSLAGSVGSPSRPATCSRRTTSITTAPTVPTSGARWASWPWRWRPPAST